MDKKMKKEFLGKLKALLKEYNACIGFKCDPSSDTYGLYGAGMYVMADGEKVASTSYWSIDASDL